MEQTNGDKGAGDGIHSQINDDVMGSKHQLNGITLRNEVPLRSTLQQKTLQKQTERKDDFFLPDREQHRVQTAQPLAGETQQGNLLLTNFYDQSEQYGMPDLHSLDNHTLPCINETNIISIDREKEMLHETVKHDTIEPRTGSHDQAKAHRFLQKDEKTNVTPTMQPNSSLVEDKEIEAPNQNQVCENSHLMKVLELESGNTSDTDSCTVALRKDLAHIMESAFKHDEEEPPAVSDENELNLQVTSEYSLFWRFRCSYLSTDKY